MTANLDWMNSAVCAQTDPDAFVELVNQRAYAREARRICASCPVKQPCLDDALADPAAIGLRGGTTEKRRRTIRAAARRDAATETDRSAA